MNAGVLCVLNCVGNLCLRDIYLSMNETVQIAGFFLNWISALHGNPANFVTSPLPERSTCFIWWESSLFRAWASQLCSFQGRNAMACQRCGAFQLGWLTLRAIFLLSHLYLTPWGSLFLVVLRYMWILRSVWVCCVSRVAWKKSCAGYHRLKTILGRNRAANFKEDSCTY